jgi:Tfp pilus assembly protein PilX
MNQTERDDKKFLIAKILIATIVLLILFLWLANLRGVFESQKESNSDIWKKISQNMDKSLKDAEDQFNKAADLTSSSTNKIFVEELLSKASSTATSSGFVATSTISTTTRAELEKELINLIKPIASSSPKRVSCPEYINCMPTIGETKPCVIPAGCEKITQIAY